ncbi:hypothetical protein GCM10009037_20400 [Halarchaeum grantii]|uniref:DUF7511 domain-containing protein n=1 Tax=Halarchaeum grantii TaxID=1193105 RepID=A0A830F3F2_9EURY|nr:hypothetical protein [Halarchaeum grantii]GGL36836.1 hypothetical protein GCM10009037_20400 [Halarchaeum grantii]
MTDDVSTKSGDKSYDADFESTVDAVRTADGDAGDPPAVRGVVEVSGGESEFTLYPPDVEEAALATTWLSAREGSYVSLDDYR